MGQRPKELTPRESLRHYWGAELRALRVGRGLSLAELAQQVPCDPSYLAKIERAERPVSAALVASCDRVLQAQGALVRLHALVESDRELTAKPRGQGSGGGADVAGEQVHVAGAAGSLAEGVAFPAGWGTGGEVVVAARMPDGRVVLVSVPRRVFLHGLGSTTVGLVTSAAAVPVVRHLPDTGVDPVEHFQHLRRVLVENDRLFGPRQVIPMVREQIAIIERIRSRCQGTDRRALVRVQAQYAEFCGWLYRDAGEHHLAESWTDRALGLSHLAEDHDLTVFVLARKAGLAVDRGVAVDAVGMGEHALRAAPPNSRLAAYAASFAGHGYALSGDQAAMERAYQRAVELLDTGDPDPHSPLGPWFGERWVALQRARSLTVLGDYHRAAEGFQAVIAELPSHSRRGRGVWLARTSRALAGDQQVEQAAALGLEALGIGAETGSARIRTELARLDKALAPWQAVPAVADFRTALRDTSLHWI